MSLALNVAASLVGSFLFEDALVISKSFLRYLLKDQRRLSSFLRTALDDRFEDHLSFLSVGNQSEFDALETSSVEEGGVCTIAGTSLRSSASP